MARLRIFWGAYWQKCLIIVAITAAILSMLLYKLGSLTGGLAPSEQSILPTRLALHGIVQNPLYLPMQLLRLILGLTPYHGYTASRLPSVICAIGVVIMFVYIVRVWYGPRTAWYGLLMLVVSPWFLHIARLAASNILYPLSLLALLVYTTEAQQPHRRWFFLTGPLLISLSLYIPGMIWLVALCTLWYREDFAAMWESASRSLRIQWLLIWPLVLSLLSYSLWKSPKLILDWAGLPHGLPQPISVLRHFGAVWSHIFVRGPQDPTMGLGYLPLLNVFATVMFIAGACFYIIHWRANRSRFLLCLALVSATLMALDGPVPVSILLPLVFALVAGGLGFLMHEWFKTFPRNPLARTLGYILIVTVLSFSTIYNLRQYFVAWPLAGATKAIFIHHI